MAKSPHCLALILHMISFSFSIMLKYGADQWDPKMHSLKFEAPFIRLGLFESSDLFRIQKTLQKLTSKAYIWFI